VDDSQIAETVWNTCCVNVSHELAIDGNHELIIDGVSGRLVPAGDPIGLAAALINALTGPDVQYGGQQARQQILARYTLSAITEQYIRLYRSLVQSQSDAHTYT
jgi:glycosyltransferase involved in cell wall biosynthesis